MTDTPDESRSQRIAELKRQIAAGTYETPGKLQSAVEALLGDFAEGKLTPGQDRPTQPK
jgi:anti-sigma28 factor (negative regulator of flagellin synthesis)